MKAFFCLMLLVFASITYSQSAVVRTGDSCPNGWSRQGGYCVQPGDRPFHSIEAAREARQQADKEAAQRAYADTVNKQAQACYATGNVWNGNRCVNPPPR